MKRQKKHKVKSVRKERDARLDLIRMLAAFLVLSVHFFLNNGYYQTVMSGESMLVMSVMRMAFMTCVPLFMLLTGYLCQHKTLTARYYLGLVRIVLTYVLCGLVCFCVRHWRGGEVNLERIIRSLLEFSAAPYAWYVEMYIGLFLLIPFLNVLWRALEDRGARKALVVTFLALTTLPAMTNLFVTVLPDWWVNIYPLTYYFLGAYFAEYSPKFSWPLGLLGLTGAVVVGGAWVYLTDAGGTFHWTAMVDWYGPTVVLSSCLLFLLLLQVPVNGAPGWLKWLLKKGSQLSLAIYLLSWCFDTAFYPILTQRVPEMPQRLPWYFVIVPAVYLCSALAAQAVEWARMTVTWCIDKVFPKARLR